MSLLGQSLPRDPAPAQPFVRCQSNRRQTRARAVCPLSAISRLMHRSMGKKKDRPFGGVSQIRSGIFIRQLREILGSRLTGYPDDARLLASNRSTDGLLDEFEANSRDCVVDRKSTRSVHHSVGKVNVHVKHAVIARLCSRSLAFELSKSPNFKLGFSKARMQIGRAHV